MRRFSKTTRIKTTPDPFSVFFFFSSSSSSSYSSSFFFFFVVVYIYKFAFRFKSGVFLGYSKPQTPVTNALIFQSGKMIIVRHVNLNESMFPFKQYLIITNALIFNHYLKKKTKR